MLPTGGAGGGRPPGGVEWGSSGATTATINKSADAWGKGGGRALAVGRVRGRGGRGSRGCVIRLQQRRSRSTSDQSTGDGGNGLSINRGRISDDEILRLLTSQ